MKIWLKSKARRPTKGAILSYLFVKQGVVFVFSEVGVIIMGMRADFGGEPMRAEREGVAEVEMVPAWILVPSSAPRN